MKTDRKGLTFQAPALAILILLLFLAPPVLASEGVLSGFFRGNESTAKTVGFNCGADANATFAYQTLAPVTASLTGAYSFSDTGHHYGLDAQLAVYTSFNPTNPAANRVGYVQTGTEDEGAISLTTGVDYVIVIQACGAFSDFQADWSFDYRGPGNLSGPSIYPAPAYFSGAFDGNDPSLPEEVVCGITDYQVTGPVRVAVAGEYVFSDSSVHDAVDISLAVYRDAFDAANPGDNLLSGFDDGGKVWLEEGVDYYLVVQPACQNKSGDFRYVLLGPSPVFRITEGVNGAWLNPVTPGQGILIEVFPDINVFFAAWFTWDTTQPGDDETADVGGPNQRWLTAQGSFQGDTATLQLYNSTGGLFDDPSAVASTAVGTMTIQFTACNAANVSYEFEGHKGNFVVNKLANDNVATCQGLMNRLKVPLD